MGTEHGKSSLKALTLAAIGIVYGDIGTSPLYTMKEIFSAEHGLAVNPDNIFGVVSLILWGLIIIVALKYVTLILRAHNRGEGGIMALTALALESVGKKSAWHFPLLVLGLFGAALFFGDGVITPAISVLSAIEGLEVATPAFQPFVVPITLTVLVALYAVQSHGTAGIGKWFGPIMLIWFFSLAAMGVYNIIKNPVILEALNPFRALEFLNRHRFAAFLALGAVVLALTGAEALYADMGHFGKRPIRLAWFSLVLPALLLNYFGQGALILADPASIQNPFYLMLPSWGLYPMVVLATLATVIASQAVISGAFSLTRQAIQLGYLPRMEIRHTSSEEIGQVYVPLINWSLLVAVLALVFGFGSSTNLAAAYGIAVTGDMMITSVLATVVFRTVFRWNVLKCAAFLGTFLVIDLAFFSANSVKIPDGGWFPLSVAALMFTVLTTWKRGTEIMRARKDALPRARGELA
ncbi:KUP/HAK/KT family potassium transporter, partial [Undibacterium luofuense]|uniref:potassium transporter Kup n=1 Tax=Undibacterium luofuense TaxID=2828733 RepID=UPI0030EDDA9C